MHFQQSLIHIQNLTFEKKEIKNIVNNAKIQKLLGDFSL